MALLQPIFFGAGVFLVQIYVAWMGKGQWMLLLSVVVFLYTLVEMINYLICRSIGMAVLTNRRIVVKNIPRLRRNFEIPLNEIREVDIGSRNLFLGQGLRFLVVKTSSGSQKKLAVPDAESFVGAYHRFIRASRQGKPGEDQIEAGIASRRAAVAVKSPPILAASDSDREASVESQHLGFRDKAAGFCSHCGKPLLSSDDFCTSCGTPRRERIVEPAPLPASRQDSDFPASRERSVENEELAEEYFDQAYEYWTHSKYKKALKECDKVIELDPEWSQGHNLRGAVLEDMDQLEEAILEYRTAVRLDPDDKDARENLSLAFNESAKGYKAQEDEEPERFTNFRSSPEHGYLTPKQDSIEQGKLSIITCPNCKMRIIPKADGTCPSCQSRITTQPEGVSGEETLEAASADRRATGAAKSTPTIPAASVADREASADLQHLGPRDEPAGFCSHCGRPLLSSDDFCTNCGTPRRDKFDKPTPPASSPIPKETVTAPVQVREAGISNESIRNASEGELASMLCKLDRRSSQEYNSDKSAYSTTCELIKEIGRKLDSDGGEELMRNVLVRAGRMGCNTRFVEGEWDRIGTWMG
jgi:tetratricopeptide (TPR) repeat protein